MWQVLSFTGKFDPHSLNNLPPLNEEDQTENQRRKTDDQRRMKKDATEARAKLRLALHYARRRQKINEGKCAEPKQLSEKALELLKLFDDGTLQREANKLTRISGNGRLRRPDGTYVDIGGSTGGYTKRVLYDWTPPDVSEFVIQK